MKTINMIIEKLHLKTLSSILIMVFSGVYVLSRFIYSVGYWVIYSFDVSMFLNFIFNITIVAFIIFGIITKRKTLFNIGFYIIMISAGTSAFVNIGQGEYISANLNSEIMPSWPYGVYLIFDLLGFIFIFALFVMFILSYFVKIKPLSIIGFVCGVVGAIFAILGFIFAVVFIILLGVNSIFFESAHNQWPLVFQAFSSISFYLLLSNLLLYDYNFKNDVDENYKRTVSVDAQVKDKEE